jgi:hypothetical protein
MKKLIVLLILICLCVTTQSDSNIFKIMFFLHTRQPDPPTPPRGRENILLVFIGESNSGGYAENDSATSDELSENALVQIWDNKVYTSPTTGTAFLNLKISNPNSNNLIGHNGFEAYVGVTHGWELELGNKAKTDYFNRNIYLVKCGQGGSKVTNWVDEVDYNLKMVQRATGTRHYLDSLKVPYTIHVCFSFGINDAIAYTDSTVFYTKTIQFLTNIRANFGDVQIYWTHIFTRYAIYDRQFTRISNIYPWFHPIVTAGLPVRVDGNHWTYYSMKKIADIMFSNIKATLN